MHTNRIGIVAAMFLTAASAAYLRVPDSAKDLMTIIINAIIAIIAVGSLVINRSESRHRIKNIDAQTEKTEGEKDKAYQDRIDAVITKNLDLFDEIEKQRAERKAMEDRMSKDMEGFKRDLRTTNESLSIAQQRILLSDQERDKYKNALSDSLAKQGELEAKLLEYQSTMNKKVDVIEKKTGELKIPESMEH